MIKSIRTIRVPYKNVFTLIRTGIIDIRKFSTTGDYSVLSDIYFELAKKIVSTLNVEVLNPYTSEWDYVKFQDYKRLEELYKTEPVKKETPKVEVHPIETIVEEPEIVTANEEVVEENNEEVILEATSEDEDIVATEEDEEVVDSEEESSEENATNDSSNNNQQYMSRRNRKHRHNR